MKFNRQTQEACQRKAEDLKLQAENYQNARIERLTARKEYVEMDKINKQNFLEDLIYKIRTINNLRNSLHQELGGSSGEALALQVERMEQEIEEDMKDHKNLVEYSSRTNDILETAALEFDTLAAVKEEESHRMFTEANNYEKIVEMQTEDLERICG